MYLGKTSDNISLYKFRYILDTQYYVGVMAQDLIYAHPEAVIIDPRGFLRVSYDQIGLRMVTHEEWLKHGLTSVYKSIEV